MSNEFARMLRVIFHYLLLGYFGQDVAKD